MTLEEFWLGIQKQGEEKRYYRYNRSGLPHLIFTNGLFFITTRLADSIPQTLLTEWYYNLSAAMSDSRMTEKDLLPFKIEYFKKIEDYLDSSKGSCLLGQPAVAKMVVDTITFYDGKDYNLLAWSVMPNHLHLLLQLLKQKDIRYELASIMNRIKSYTATQANKMLNRSGTLWMNEYLDRFIRTPSHLISTTKCILNNPAKLGLSTEFTGCVFDDFKKGLIPRLY